MKLDYIYADPTGNITLLVPSLAKPELYGETAVRLLALESSGEQVGFIEKPKTGGDIRLHMAGGEFCGNASLSAAALSLFLSDRSEGIVNTEVFGISSSLKAELFSASPGMYSGSIEMPLPLSVGERLFSFADAEYTLPLVDLPGISHVIFPGAPFSGAEEAVRQWCLELGVPALGIMFLSEDLSSLTPLVYVSSGDTLYWEHSCASGTCSAAAWLARSSKDPIRYAFSEPGGVLSAEACIGYLKLIGNVKLEKRSIEI